MTIYETNEAFEKKYNFRLAEKCCLNCQWGNPEYDCEERPFWVKRYYDGTEDGVIYIGIDYKHPN